MIRPKHIFFALVFSVFPILAQADDDVRFALITDIHTTIGSHAQKDLSLCISDINSQKNTLDFVIASGDLTNFGSDEELSYVKQALDSLQIPYWVTAGNHDSKWSESGCNTFLKVFGYERFSFRCKGWRFMGCKSGPDMRMAPGLVPAEDVEWLSKEGRERTILINHYPMDTSVLNYFDVVRAAKKSGTEFMIGGHWHRNVEMNYDGIPAALCRSSLSKGEDEAGYNVVTISSDNFINFTERSVNQEGSASENQWYSCELKALEEDNSTGLPESYPWLRYEVNDEYPEVREVWKIEENSNIGAGFAIDEKGHAFYPLVNGTIKCINISDGTTRWTRKLPGKVFSTPAYSNGRIIVGCTDGNIYGLSSRKGKVLWSIKAEKSVLGSPVILGKNGFVGDSEGCMRCFQVKNGILKWEHKCAKGFIESKPYVDEEQLVFGSWGNDLISMNPQSGEIQWIAKAGKTNRMLSPAVCTPVKADGKIYIAVPSRRLNIYNAKTGKGMFNINGGREGLTLSKDGSLLYVKTMYSTAYAARLDGEIVWSVRTPLGYDISPTNIAEIGDVLVLPTDKGNLAGISRTDGHLLWQHKIGLGLINPIYVIDKNHILVSTMDGKVAEIEL